MGETIIPTETEVPTDALIETPVTEETKPQEVIKQTVEKSKNFSSEPSDEEAVDIMKYSSTSTPIEASQIISRSEKYDMHPDSYGEMKSEMNVEVDAEERTPAQVSNAVKDFSKQSSEHAALIKPELGTLEVISRQAQSMRYNLFQKNDLEDRIQELNYEDRTSENGLSDNKRNYLDNLYKIQDQRTAHFRLDGYQQIPGQVAGLANDMVTAVWDNKLIVGASTAAGAGYGLFGANPVTVGAGALTGFGWGIAGAMAKDAYYKTADNLYAELRNMKDENGKPLNLDRDSMQNISAGVGVVAGALEAVTGKVLTSGLKKLLSPKTAAAFVIKNPRFAALMAIWKNSLKTGGVSTIEEVSAELTSIVGENYAKGKQTEASFWNAIEKTTDQIMNDPATQKRLKMTAAVGFVGGKVMSGGPALITYPSIKQTFLTHNENINKYQSQKQTVKEAIKTLEAQDNFNAISKMSLETDVKKIAPDQMSKLRQKMFEEAGYKGKVWFNDGDLTYLEGVNPELAAKIRALDNTESSADGGTSAPVGMKPHEFLDLVDDAPEVAEYIRLNPEAPNPRESRVLLEKMNDAQTKRQAIFDSLGVDEKLSPEQIVELQTIDATIDEIFEDGPSSEAIAVEKTKLDERVDELNTEIEQLQQEELAANEKGEFVSDELGEKQDKTVAERESVLREIEEKKTEIAKLEKEFYNRRNFTEGIESVIPEAQRDQFNESQFKARDDVAEQIKEEFDAREEKVENRVVRANEKINKAIQEEQNRESLDLVDKFKADPKAPQPEGHKKKGYSALAIDPKYLPDTLRDHLVADPKLVKNKAFVEGGITPNEAAALAGFKDGESLIKVLSNAPTKQELTLQRQKASDKIRKQVQKTREKTKSQRLDKVFDDVQKLNKKTLDFMKAKEWGSTKLGITKVHLPIPKIAELNYRASKVIANTKVGVLSPKQYNAGEKASRKKASQHILKNEPADAFAAVEQSMLNSELTRESLRARKKINNGRKVVKRMTSKSGQKSLKASGLGKQADVILNLFNLKKSSKKTAARQQSFNEYIQERANEGESIIVPEGLDDIRQRGEDMTVEQYTRVVERLQTLEKQAKLKNKLLRKSEKRSELAKLQTIEAKVERLVETNESHPDHNPERISKKVKDPDSQEFIDKKSIDYQVGTAFVSNLKNIATQLDQERLGGENYEAVAQPMVDGETVKRALNDNVGKQIAKISKAYGEKKFKKAFNEFKTITEFEGYNELGMGVMSKSSLWRLFSYLGDPQGRERIANFKNETTGEFMTVEKVQAALEQHLDHADAKLVQNFTNIFKSFEEKSFGLHERTTGVAPTMVKGVPITFKGKVYDGGYTPLNYLNTSIDEKINRYLEVLGNKELAMFGGKADGKLYGALRAAEQTEQGRLADRTGSSKPLDTSFFGFVNAYEEIAHDLAYREVGTDTLKLLRQPEYEKSIKETVGEAKYETLVNAVIETVGKTHGNDTLSPFSKEHALSNKIFASMEGAFAVSVLGLNPTSVAMQPLSFGAAALRMGPKGGRYILKAIGNYIKDVGTLSYRETRQAAIEINPDIQRNMDNIDDSLNTSTYDDIPKTLKIGKTGKHSNTTAMLRKGKDSFVEFAMIGLKKLDTEIKIAVTHASYAQFKNGDVEAYPLSRLDKMSPDQIEVAARKYAKQVADLALTTSATIDKSAVEKIAKMSFFTRFYTDVRSQLNTGLSQGRKISNSIKRAKGDLKQGNVLGAAKNVKQAAGSASSLFLIYTMNQLYTDFLHKEETPLDELGQVSNMDDLKNWAGNALNYTALAPAKTLVGSTPIVRDIAYSVGGWSANKKIRLPITSALENYSMSVTGLADWYEGYDMTFKQKKALWSVAGVPANGTLKIHDMIEDSEMFGNATDFMSREIDRLNKNINKFIKNNEGKKDQEDLVEQARAVKKSLPQENASVKTLVPEMAKETISVASSGGDWTAYNADTGAAGIYQFTEERWNELTVESPDLGLTENGRVSKSPSEQNKAMDYVIEQNSKGLVIANIPITKNTLFGSHHFGLENYVKIHQANRNDKLSKILGEEAKNPVFKDFKTVRSVQDYINRQIKEAEKQEDKK